MRELLTLALAMNAARYVSLFVAMATIVWWTPSFIRSATNRGLNGDGPRALWVALAWSILFFQVRWLGPNLSELARLRIWLVAQVLMAGIQIAAIYHNGGADPRFDIGRTMRAHAAIVLLCIVFAWSTR